MAACRTRIICDICMQPTDERTHMWEKNTHTGHSDSAPRRDDDDDDGGLTRTRVGGKTERKIEKCLL